MHAESAARCESDQIAIEDIRTRRFERAGTDLSFEEFKDVVDFSEWVRIEETDRVRRGT
jgi:hypothetical protein